MSEDRRKLVETVYQQAVALPAAERDRFLGERCGGNAALRAEIESLIAQSAQAGDLLRTPTRSTDAAPSEPQSIGSYRILEKLGEGGFGIVYVAEQTRPVRRRVALKLIKAGMDTKAVLARFEAERQALALMEHPNIAKVFDAGATDVGRPYFVMELVRGEPLTTYCDRHRSPTRQRLELFVSVCHAVQHAHQKGIIHRDLKPTNILVTVIDGKPVPKVIDFGIAKATSTPLTDKTLHTVFGQMVGTPAYMSPEQVERTGVDVDTTTDIYSLGVILYELLAGRLPFDPQDLAKAGRDGIQRIIREVDPPTPSTRVSKLEIDASEIAGRRGTDPARLARELRGEVDWIVMRAMEKDRTRRYQTVQALAQEIGCYLRDEPVMAGPPSAVYRLKKFARRNRLAIAVVGAIVFGIVGAAAGLTYALIQANQRRSAVEAALRESDAVTVFLSNMLEAVDPAEEGSDVTVRQVLDEAAERIDAEFEGQPLVAARLRTTIGVTYRALGEFESAEGHLRSALETRQRLLGDTAPATLDSRSELAWLDHARGQYDAAEISLTEVLEVRRRVLGEEHPTTLASINALASNYIMQQRHEEAIPLLESAVEVMRRTIGEDHTVYDVARSALALAYREQGRYEDAERLLVETLAADRRRYGEKHVETLASMQNLASLHRQLGQYEEAEPLYAFSGENAHVVFGAEHPTTLRYQGNQALLYAEMQRFAEAEVLMRQVLEARRRFLGDHNPSTLVTALNLALLYNRMGRYDDSESLAARTVEIASRELGADHFYAIAAQGALGVANLGQGRAARAEKLLAEVVPNMKENFSPRHWRVGVALSQYGSALAALGRFSEAEAQLHAGYEILTESFGMEQRHVQDAIRRLAEFYASWDKPAKQAEWQTKLVDETPGKR